MNKNNLFRFASWCALVTALLMVLIHVVPSGAPAIVGMIVGLAAMLGLTYVFYALYVAHRAESAGLSLAGLILWLLSLVLNLVSLVTSALNFLSNVGSLLWALPFLIFGYLAWRSARMPRGLAALTLLTGLVYVILAVAGFMGSAGFVDTGNLVGDILMLVWLVWLWRTFLSKKFASA
jgi:hypothetical protein